MSVQEPDRRPERLNLSSRSFADERAGELLKLFPEADAEGQIDWEELRSSLGEDATDGPDKFSFTWAGKRSALRLLRVPSRATLDPVRDESVDFDSTRNVFIEGDNLEVLKRLYRSYFGKVQMIYLDPPYNTDKDLIYHDDFSDPLAAYLKATGQADDNGNLLTSNPDTSGRYHSTWLSMMYPRLLIARQLLTEGGVLYVSCNDIEQANLRLLLNEVFGEENHAATLIWNNEGNIDNQSKIKVNHEYILMYVRDLEKFKRPGVIDPNIDEGSKLYNEVLENTIVKNGPANPASTLVLPVGFPAAFDEGTIAAQTVSYPYLHDAAVVEKSVLTKPVRIESGWSSANLLKLFIKNGFAPIQDGEGKETRFALYKTGAIYSYKTRGESQSHVLSVIRNVGTTKQNSSRLARWGLDFDYPKPVMLIQYLCQIATDKGDIVMDLFAGSGTTAEAVMRLNREDGGRRRFIMVQLPEQTSPKSKARKKGYTDIADMGKERIRKAAEELLATPLVEAGQAPEDLGVRVFKLMLSHFKPWEGVPEPGSTA
jgi:adenine-specific DNA-methyltransferase